MSKERELLERVLESRTFMQGVALRREIEELLAQPEQDLTYDLPSWENGYAAGRSAENERLLVQILCDHFTLE